MTPFASGVMDTQEESRQVAMRDNSSLVIAILDI
jgi:hypothetical protein